MRSAETPTGAQPGSAIAIRDDKGDGSAATKTVQLKACQFIEGPPDKAGVTVNVNQQTTVAATSPGYVIRLPAKSDQGAIEP